MTKKGRKGRLSLGTAIQEECDLDEISPSQEVDSRANVAREELKAMSDGPQSNMSKSQIAEYIQNCVKLSQDNKINLKNAFDVKLIDYFTTLTNVDEAANFSLASMSLDASSKIYGLRVDAVYQDTVRLASGFGVNKNNNGAENDGDCNEDAEPAGDVTKAAKKVKRKVRSTYVCQDDNQINKNIEMDYDMVGNDILTLVHQNDGNALGRIISGNVVPYDDESTVDIEGSRNCLREFEHLPKDQEVPSLPFKGALKILPVLEDIDVNATLRTFEPDVSMHGDDLNGSVVFDPHAEALPVGDEEPPEMMVPPMDGTLGGDPMGMTMPNSLFQSMADTTLGISGMAFNDLNGTFLHKFVPTQGNLAGPTGFRMRKFNILGVEKGPKRGTAKKVELEYIARPDENNFNLYISADITDAGPRNKKKGGLVNCLLPSTRERWSSDSTCLRVEIDQTMSIKKFASLFVLPEKRTRLSKQRPAHDNDNNSQLDFFDDPDNRPLSPGANINLSDEVGCDGERNFQLDHIEEVEHDPFPQASQPMDDQAGYDNLISAPGIQANRLTIGYTKAARKFNVRQMKSSMWKVLTHTENEVVEEEGSRESEDDTKLEGEMKFSDLYEGIQPHLNAINKKNVTLPLAFLSMLMLCNEKHLELKEIDGPENQLDFVIAQAPDPKDD